MRPLTLWLALFALILTSCAFAQVTTPEPSAMVAPTNTFAPTNTRAPTATTIPTVTPTPIPTLPPEQAGGLQGVPDPRYSNSELFDLAYPDAPIPQFVNAMQMAGINVTAEQVKEGITFHLLSDWIIGAYAFEGENDAAKILNGEYPLLLAERDKNDKWNWSVVTLRKLADKAGIEIGVLLLSDQKTASIEAREFNLGILTFGWNDHVDQNGTVKLRWPDAQFEVARKASMDTRFMHIVDSNGTPEWVNSFSRSELLEFTTDVISKIMEHYGNQVSQYVVVNEPYIYPYRQEDPFYKILGSDYILTIFEEARKADADSLLIYNDTDNHMSSGMTTILTQKIVQSLKSKGLIDGVGVQMHLGFTSELPTETDKDDIIQTLRAYGVPVHVTELDIDITDLPGSPDERYLKQAEMYRVVIESVLESNVCKDISFWGIGDKFSWLEVALNRPNADPTLFDDNLKPKPAYYAVSSALLAHLQRSLQN